MTEITVLSGKGGTGKTSITAAFATLGADVVVADCDVDAANLHLILKPDNYAEHKFLTGYKATINKATCINCGLCLTHCRFDAIAKIDGKITINPTSCDGCKLCSRVCPTQSISMEASDKSAWFAGFFRNGRMIHAKLAPGEENTGKLVSVVRENARKTAQDKGWETIIIDGPPGIGCPVISSVTGADKAIIVTEPTRSGFHDLLRIIELIANYKLTPYVIINKCDINNEITEQIKNWCLDKNIIVAGQIPFNTDIVEAMLNCRSIIEWKPESDITKEIINIWTKINKDGKN